ncbi:MAG: hypothetical protein HQM01_08120 [Magnetococcales bacterium]|nr:hypothetical protein [Magnetococcales bacterium]
MNATTVDAYRRDVARFIERGGVIPASPEMVSHYLWQHANSHRFATLYRWLVSIGQASVAHQVADPTKSALVKSTLNTIKAFHGNEQRSVARLTRAEVEAICHAIDLARKKRLMRDQPCTAEDSEAGWRLKDRRDMALLLAGSAGGLGRTDLVELSVEDVAWKTFGMELRLKSRWVEICHTLHPYPCPCCTLKAWLDESGIVNGPVFQGVTRHNQLAGALTGHGVSMVIKALVKMIGLDPSPYSGCSLRPAHEEP